MDWFSSNEDTDYPPADYETFKRPAKPGKRVNVLTYVRLDHLYEISEDSSTIHFHLTVRLKWNDTRLRFTPIAHGPDSRFRIVKADSIWHPSLRVLKDVTHHEPLETAKVSCHGEVTYTAHYDSRVWAEIDFSHYPFDSHKFVLDISSYRYSADRVLLNMTNFDPQAVNLEALSGPMWRVVAFNQKSVPNKRTVYLDNDSVVEMSLYVKRRVTNPLVVMIFPMGLLGILSTTPLFISIEKFSDRATIGATGCFTILLFHHVVNEYFPKLGYLTWLHHYTIFTNVYIFGAFFAIMALQVIHRAHGGSNELGWRERGDSTYKPNEKKSRTSALKAEGETPMLYPAGEATRLKDSPRTAKKSKGWGFSCLCLSGYGAEDVPYAQCLNDRMAAGFVIGYICINIFMFAIEFENWYEDSPMTSHLWVAR